MILLAILLRLLPKIVILSVFSVALLVVNILFMDHYTKSIRPTYSEEFIVIDEVTSMPFGYRIDVRTDLDGTICQAIGCGGNKQTETHVGAFGFYKKL